MTPNILSIAGSDSGGGAGIQADIKTIMALGGYGMTAITALTAQNGVGVTGVFAPPADFVALEINTILAGFKVSAAKTGMLFSAEIIAAVAQAIAKRDFPLVVDPVSVSQSGSQLLEDDAVASLIDLIIPACDLLTPNLPETEMLTGIHVQDEKTARQAGEKLLNMGAKAVLIKGGHMPGAIMVTDYLINQNCDIKAMSQAKVDTNNNHGTGCTLSAAIACELGKGMPLEVAVARAQKFINLALLKSYNPGKGCGPVNHSAGFSGHF